MDLEKYISLYKIFFNLPNTYKIATRKNEQKRLLAMMQEI